MGDIGKFNTAAGVQRVATVQVAGAMQMVLATTFRTEAFSLLDVRFEDGILMFLKSREEIGQAFDMLVPLGKVAPNPGATMAQSEHPAG